MQNNPPQPPAFDTQDPLVDWCIRRGFGLVRRSGADHVYALHWKDAATRRMDRLEIDDREEVIPAVEARIASGAIQHPEAWYLYWYVTELPPDRLPWCRWRRWVHVFVAQGAITPKRYRTYRHGNTYDPAPYPTPEACVAAAALLGLENGARLCLWASVTSMSFEETFLPSTECTPEAVEELVLDWVRKTAPRESVYRINTSNPLWQMQAVGLVPQEVEKVIERLLSDGRLEWAGETDTSGEERRYVRVVDASGYFAP